ncbi:LytTR family DNA-binding domain-containing protein [Alistipes sp. OttesenSCG-928-B03]|nr:LytTR family DNA-binding domain-containing protein [Alistipes sp. OttesenSCG-928-B03]
MKIRCIAIDDEPLALAQMASYIDRTDFLAPCGMFRNAAEAERWLAENTTDLIFVDINMPGINGLDFVRSLAPKPLIVFTTAYAEHALEGFRVDATDYLLKPIGYADFLRAAEKAERQFRLLATAPAQHDQPAVLFVKSEYRKVRIEIDDILYIESRSEYVRIVTEGSKPVMTLGSIRSYEESLPAESFARVHRSYIVNTRHISSVERRCVVLSGGIRIPVSGTYEKPFRTKIGV